LNYQWLTQLQKLIAKPKFIAISSCADDIPSNILQGCTDSSALNYNENALVDNGSCGITTKQEDIDKSIFRIELF